MPLVIGLHGQANVGKDTVGAMLVESGFTRIALADPVRQMAMGIDPIIEIVDECEDGTVRIYKRLSEHVKLVGWEYAKAVDDVRRLLQRIGTEGVREVFGARAWIDLADTKVGLEAGPVVVTDVRFANEAEWVRGLGGQVWEIVRGNRNYDKHASEQQLPPGLIDLTIPNNGTRTDLHARVEHHLASVGMLRNDMRVGL